MKNLARKRLTKVKDEWPLIRNLLPKGWEGKAKELGAVRRLRGVGSVEMVLRILLMHLADGLSLKSTSARAAELGWAQISAVGILHRLRAAERWLAWLAASLRPAPPRRPLSRRCLAVDATTVCEPGKTGSQWRVHWSVDLASLQCRHFEVTDVTGGEKFARFPISEDDLVMGDAGYSSVAGIDHVRQHGGEVLVRVNARILPMYNRKDGEKFDVLDRVRGMKVGEVRACPAWVKGPEGRWHRGRLVAIRRSLAATRRILRQRRHRHNSRGRKLGPRGRKLARYVLLWTSLPREEMSKREVLARYRQRWQLELVFKRAKSIMGLGQLPKHSDASSRAWLNGKLLVAMLVDKLWRNAELFSPWGYALPPAKSLA